MALYGGTKVGAILAKKLNLKKELEELREPLLDGIDSSENLRTPCAPQREVLIKACSKDGSPIDSAVVKNFATGDILGVTNESGELRVICKDDHLVVEISKGIGFAPTYRTLEFGNHDF